MKLYIKQKVFSLKDRFTVWDEFGRERYLVEGKIFSLGKKLSVTDINGVQRIYLEQRLLTFLPKYEISVDGSAPLLMKKELTFFKPSYSIPELGISVKGDFFAHDYTVYQNEVPIASLSKQWLTWGDTYEINIPDQSYELITLAVILTIDCMMANQQSSSNT